MLNWTLILNLCLYFGSLSSESGRLWFSLSQPLQSTVNTGPLTWKQLPRQFCPLIYLTASFMRLLSVPCCLTRPISWCFYLSISISNNNLYSSRDSESKMGRGSFLLKHNLTVFLRTSLKSLRPKGTLQERIRMEVEKEGKKEKLFLNYFFGSF